MTGIFKNLTRISLFILASPNFSFAEGSARAFFDVSRLSIANSLNFSNFVVDSRIPGGVVATAPKIAAKLPAVLAPRVSIASVINQLKKIAGESKSCLSSGLPKHPMRKNYLTGVLIAYARSNCRPNDKVRSAMTGTNGEGSQELKSIYKLVLGLGLLESDGNFNEGKDKGASNTNGITTEAGAWQTSYNVRGYMSSRGAAGKNATSAADKIQSEYQAAGSQACHTELIANKKGDRIYGSGNAAAFQNFLRSCPVGAAEHAAITVKNAKAHYGPLIRKNNPARPVPGCDSAFDQVAKFINQAPENCQALSLNKTSEVPPAQLAKYTARVR